MTRKQAAKTIAFLALTLALLVMLTYMLRTNGAVKDRFAGFYAEKKNSIDVIMIGSSPVFPYYSAPQMYGEEGITAYPLSTNSQRPVAELYLAKEALKYQQPDLLVFEVRMYTSSERYLTENMAYTRGVTDNLRYSPNRVKTVLAMLDESDVEEGFAPDDEDRKVYTYLFDIFKYHSNWRSLKDAKQWRMVFFRLRDPLKGFESSAEVGPCALTDYSGVTEEKEIPATQDKRLSELLDWLSENHLKALFLVSPYAESEEEAEEFNYIERRVTAEGQDFLDLNDYYEEMGLDGAEDFSDYGVHVNAVGSEKVTSFFGKYLKEHYDLTDHRADPSYSGWDDAYENWKSDSAEKIAAVKEHVRTGTYAEEN